MDRTAAVPLHPTPIWTWPFINQKQLFPFPPPSVHLTNLGHLIEVSVRNLHGPLQKGGHTAENKDIPVTLSSSFTDAASGPHLVIALVIACVCRRRKGVWGGQNCDSQLKFHIKKSSGLLPSHQKNHCDISFVNQKFVQETPRSAVHYPLLWLQMEGAIKLCVHVCVSVYALGFNSE